MTVKGNLAIFAKTAAVLFPEVGIRIQAVIEMTGLEAGAKLLTQPVKRKQ